MHVPWSFYAPQSARGTPGSSTRYEPPNPSDQAASQAQRWEVLLRLRQLFVRRPAAGLQLLDAARRRGGSELELVLTAAREAAHNSQDVSLLRDLIEVFVKLGRTREAFDLSRRLLCLAEPAREDLIRAAKLAARCGRKDQARAYLIQAGVPGVVGVAPEDSESGEERSDELGP